MAVNMLNDIISDHRERMLNLKKYYPFFKLIDVSFSQFKDGKYEILDMGYIVMGVLRFFIEENNFKEKDVTYPEYLHFLSIMLKRDFGLNLTEEEYKEIADYVFDKIKNDGRPFRFEYFDPIDRKKRVSRMSIIESEIRDNTVWYSISPDAIEFYLDTKEIKDESKISVQQLLLEKMIRSQNFKGGTEVVARINEEVNRLQLKKNEVLTLLSGDIFAGIDAYEDFVSTGMRWFEDEEKLFKKNKELIDVALSRMGTSPKGGESYYSTVSEIYELENQLKVAMNRHADLLRACTDMQKMTDEAVRKAKLGRLRVHVDFQAMMADMIKNQDASVLASMITPLFKPRIRKNFNVTTIDEALTLKPVKYDPVEKVSTEPAKDIVYADELEDKRIQDNYIFIMRNLIQAVEQKERFTLGEFNEVMSRTYSPEILKNADYFSFFVNLCQRQKYTFGGKQQETETFLDGIVQDQFTDMSPVSIQMTMHSDRKLELGPDCEITDVEFVRQ